MLKSLAGCTTEIFSFAASQRVLADWHRLFHPTMADAYDHSQGKLCPTRSPLADEVMQERQLIPLVIVAFQGLSSGDAHRDAQPLRYMVHEGLPVVLVQSFDAVSFASSTTVQSLTCDFADDGYLFRQSSHSFCRCAFYRNKSTD